MSSLGMLFTQGDLTVLDHQQPMTQPHWELSLANQLIRYAVHLRGPQVLNHQQHMTQPPLGFQGLTECSLPLTPEPSFFRPLALIRELSGSPTAKPWVQPSGNCSGGN